VITSLLQPVLVKGTKKMVEQLLLTKEQLEFEKLHNFELLNNHKVGTSTPIYVRIDK
jgi:methionyl-tRNA synthetase